MKGDQALRICKEVYFISTEVCKEGSSLNLQMDLGFQYFNKSSKLKIEAIPASISGSIGPI